MAQTKVELPEFPFPVFLRDRELSDRTLRNRLPLELFLRHEGHKYSIYDEEFVLSISDSPEHPRDSLKLKTSTFKGMSLGAIHYYGQLMFPSINFRDIAREASISGSGIPKTPDIVKLHRPLTNEEIKSDERFHGYSPGELYPGFNNLGEIIDRARKVMKVFFPGFRLVFGEQK